MEWTFIMLIRMVLGFSQAIFVVLTTFEVKRIM